MVMVTCCVPDSYPKPVTSSISTTIVSSPSSSESCLAVIVISPVAEPEVTIIDLELIV